MKLSFHYTKQKFSLSDISKTSSSILPTKHYLHNQLHVFWWFFTLQSLVYRISKLVFYSFIYYIWEFKYEYSNYNIDILTVLIFLLSTSWWQYFLRKNNMMVLLEILQKLISYFSIYFLVSTNKWVVYKIQEYTCNYKCM